MSHAEHQRAAAGLVVRFAVLTLSDTRTPDTDSSGQAIREMIEAAGHTVATHALIRDEPPTLAALLRQWIEDPTIDAIITNGGTGISKRDRTIPTVQLLLDVTLPGFGELFRSLSYQQIGPAAMLSRAVAGIAADTFLAALPGSTPAVTLAMSQLILPQIRHLTHELRR